VCTHFLPAAIASVLKARGHLRARLAVVVTDFDVHGLGVVPRVDRYFVALEETPRHLVRLGVPAARCPSPQSCPVGQQEFWKGKMAHFPAPTISASGTSCQP
jgi:Monogalactosyldiacylglycerol (MGDG) synthase